MRNPLVGHSRLQALRPSTLAVLLVGALSACRPGTYLQGDAGPDAADETWVAEGGPDTGDAGATGDHVEPADARDGAISPDGSDGITPGSEAGDVSAPDVVASDADAAIRPDGAVTVDAGPEAGPDAVVPDDAPVVLPDGASTEAGDGTEGGTVLPDGATDAEIPDGGAPDGGTDGGGTDGGTGPSPRITICPGDALPSLSTGACSVTAGSATLLLVTADILLPGEVLRGGQVAVDQSTGRITCVACDCSASAAGATAITCPDAVLSPGLINAHDHLTYAQNPPYTRTTERYEQRHDWRRGQRGHTDIAASGGASADQMRWAELRFVMSGATSVNGSGGATGFMRNLDGANMESLGQPQVDYDTFPLGDSSGTQLTSGCGYPSLPTTSGIMADNAYTPHVSEGIDRVARNEFLCIRSGTNDIIQPQTALIHGIALQPTDIAQMANRGTKLIWSPRSNVTLYGDTARAVLFDRLGVTVALGTDWMPTGSMNMLRELNCADTLNASFMDRYFSDEKLWLMVTRNAAQALGMGSVLGTLASGRVADLALFDARMRTDHRAVVGAGASDVLLVLRGGAALYGDSALVQALPGGSACDALSVCGSAKLVCVSRETGGRNLSALSTSVGGSAYPLFYCGEPANEPSCLPFRAASVDGSTTYTGLSTMNDRDADGIADSTDLCPTVFDPKRPVDMGLQADFDRDGVGDACDPCPFDPGATTCTTWSPTDRDGDGRPEAMDNCPEIPNPSQADGDMDGVGDVCDPCPTVSNPGGSACPYSIRDIKTGVAGQGTAVALRDVVVTGLARNGFYVQTPTTAAGYTGPDFTGIFVFTSTAPTVMIGQQVTVSSATVSTFRNQIQLVSPTVSATASGVALPPVVAALPSEIVMGGSRATALEGVRVRVVNLTVSDNMPAPATGDTTAVNEFVVDGGLRIDDTLFLLAPFASVGERFDAVTGIVILGGMATKLNPTAAADFEVSSPTILPFAAGPYFARAGGSAPADTLPTALTLRVARAMTTAQTVVLSSDHPAEVAFESGGMLMLPAGTTSLPIRIQGLTAGTTPATVTAQIGTSSRTAQVLVLAPSAVPATVTLTPATATVASGSTAMLSVTLDVPAPAGGTTVSLSSTGGATVPATVLVPADALTATFSAGIPMMTGTVTVTATLGSAMSTSTLTVTEAGAGRLVINEVDYDSVGTDTAEFLELFNGGSTPVDLATVAVVLINGANNAEYGRLTMSGTLAPGGYAIWAGSGVTGIASGALRGTALPNDSIQNGAPDGAVLITRTGNTVLDALSYEGPITAGQISGWSGTTNLVEGTVLPTSVADSTSAVGSLSRIPNGNDTDNAATDWVFTSTPTPGAANIR